MKKAIVSFIVCIMAIVSVPTSAFALCSQEQLDKGCVSTNILGEDGCKCDENGESINDMLNLVVDILSIGVGIVGVIGISIVGIQYLTASGDEAKLTKSKRRMLEIIIGLVVYVLLYAILRWLLPGFGS